MALPAWTLGRDTITVLTSPGTDPHGDPTGPEQRTPVAGCQVQPAGSTETLDGRDTVTTRARVFAPASAQVTATSRVEWDGRSWDVDGEPGRWPDTAGNPHHLEFTMIRTTG
ncbi:hypothetical protein [Actinomadura litoris]|uniref:hypothetical protein n=1 Tax=Actinomadura litoris TaxID=2678616 RepID=UPI001FA7285F|nr:hypothetical protein [Actinomadura litoris]